MTKAEKCKEWRKNNPDHKERKNKERNKKYAEDPEYKNKTNRSNVLKQYRTTIEWYEVKLAEQGGHCALCPNTTGSKGNSLHVDHSHFCCGEYKRFTCGNCNRGLLCNGCNIRLGYLEQTLSECLGTIVPDPGTWLDRALQYLQKYVPTIAHKGA